MEVFQDRLSEVTEATYILIQFHELSKMPKPRCYSKPTGLECMGLCVGIRFIPKLPAGHNVQLQLKIIAQVFVIINTH
jgi:hypothetical protein